MLTDGLTMVINKQLFLLLSLSTFNFQVQGDGLCKNGIYQAVLGKCPAGLQLISTQEFLGRYWSVWPY